MWLLAGLLCLAGMPSDIASQSAPSSRPATMASVVATQPGALLRRAEALRLRRVGIEAALAGRFQDAQVRLQRAKKLAPEDPAVSAALKLLQACAAGRKASRGERDVELAVAIGHVRLALLAQSYLPKLAEAGIGEKLRKEISAVTSAYYRVGGSEALERAAEKEAAEIKINSLKALKRSTEPLAKAVKLLKGREGRYAEMFRGVAEKLGELLAAYRQAGQAVETDTLKARNAGAKKLSELEDELTDVLAGLEAMTSEKPWRVGLVQAAMARDIAPDPGALAQQPWYRRLVAAIKAAGQNAVEDAKWRDALSAYAGLQTLEPDNQEYRNQVKTVRRRVRVLSLYGGKQDATTQPAEPDWPDYVRGVDVEMVRTAIARLHQNYVEPVDYRELVRGALMSVKVLAETSELAGAFPALGDESKRRSFLKTVEWLMQSMDTEDWLGHEDLELALNVVVGASERTVRIPTAVLAMEFADGFLDELDRFSSMVWPRDMLNFEKTMKGHF